MRPHQIAECIAPPLQDRFDQIIVQLSRWKLALSDPIRAAIQAKQRLTPGNEVADPRNEFDYAICVLCHGDERLQIDGKNYGRATFVFYSAYCNSARVTLLDYPRGLSRIGVNGLNRLDPLVRY